MVSNPLEVGHMDNQRHRPEMHSYQPETWRNDDANLCREDRLITNLRRSATNPNAQEQCRLMQLLGLINYKILTGNKVYIEVGGVVYKTLYGGYWRSVFTGIEHYLLRCEEISGSKWRDGSDVASVVDLPIAYSNGGWTASGHSLSFMLSRD
jgi:hypothetical protein